MAYATMVQCSRWKRRGGPELMQSSDFAWEDVERKLKELAGYQGGMVMLVPECFPAGDHLVVMWQEGEYECQAHGPNGGAILIDPALPRAFPADGDWPHRAVPLPAVLQAAKTYHATGELDPSLSWEEAVSGNGAQTTEPRLLRGKALQAVLGRRRRQSGGRGMRRRPRRR
jgi:hypothetical protein